MKKIYIFDVDGTLTPSRRAMTEDFEAFFSKWAKKNTFYLVSGSNLEKIQEQLPGYILDLAAGVFPCGGNQLFINDSQKYNREFKPSEDLLSFLQKKLENTDYTTKAGNHIEDRGSMLNFSIVGRDCSLEQRQLGVKTIFCERINQNMKLRRGFTIKEGEKILIIEDVLSTGGSLKEVMKLVNHYRGTICGIGIIVDRSSSKIDLHEEFFSVTKQVANIFSPEDIPDSLKNIPPTKPGSKNIDV